MEMLFGRQSCLFGLKILESTNGLLIRKALTLLAKLYIDKRIDWLTYKEKNKVKALMEIFLKNIILLFGKQFKIVKVSLATSQLSSSKVF